MPGFKLTYCAKCRRTTSHDIYISSGDYLHSLCMDCGKDNASDARVSEINGDGMKECPKCNVQTEHIRYISQGDYIHWFCCSCGKDIGSDSKVR